MKYTNFLGNEVSLLGLGTMRLPLIPNSNKIDEEQVFLMVDAAIAGGINYFDTAYPYHEGNSELVIGKALKRYSRDMFFLANKYPGHQIALEYKPNEIFEEQLKKCEVEYFDYYLLHNVCENSLDVYMDPKWNIINYFVDEVKKGRIKHLGFSSHARCETLEFFLNKYNDKLDFCQIQLNYVDYHLQEADKKLQILGKYNMPIIVMEPLRGGKLSRLDDYSEKLLKKLRPWDSTSSWAFRWLMEINNIKVILSGMSNMKQLEDNLRTFNYNNPLDSSERNLLVDIADKMSANVPCTSCKYCVSSCPKKLDIPRFMNNYNDIVFSKNFTIGMQLDALKEDKKPSNCIKCGNCMKVCPQKINIPKYMHELVKIVNKDPSWAEVCKKREEDARKLSNRKSV